MSDAPWRSLSAVMTDPPPASPLAPATTFSEPHTRRSDPIPAPFPRDPAHFPEANRRLSPPGAPHRLLFWDRASSSPGALDASTLVARAASAGPPLALLRSSVDDHEIPVKPSCDQECAQ